MSSRLGAKQRDCGYGGSELNGAEDCQRWAEAQRQRRTDEENVYLDIVKIIEAVKE